MPITPLPSPPQVTDTPSQFNTKAFAWVGALGLFTTEANALQSDVTAKEASVSIGAAAVAAQSPVANAAAAAIAKNQTEALRDEILTLVGPIDNSQVLIELTGQDVYAIDMAGQALKEVAGVPDGVDLIGNFFVQTLDSLGVGARQAASNLQLVPAPASASARGNPGEWAVDSDYIYICTAINTWKRVGIATWP